MTLDEVRAKPKGDCLVWTGPIGNYGYGRVFGRGKGGRSRQAHRVAWESVHGKIPSGLVVCHRCDNRACVNVDHLFLGTAKDNYEDARAKGRLSHGERHGSAKLRESDIATIHALRGAGMSSYKIAKVYGVAPSTIQRVLNGQCWGHVPARAALDAALNGQTSTGSGGSGTSEG